MKFKIIIALTIVLVIGGAGYYFSNKNEGPVYSYTSMNVRVGRIAQTIEATGIVSPRNRLEIKSPIAGRIEEILVKEGDDVKRGSILAWTSSTERAALLDSIRTKGESEIKKWEELYRPTPIMAPIDGTVILKSMETGQSFSGTDVLFTMADQLIVKASVDETDIAQIKLKQKARIVLDAYSDKKIKGEVVHLAYDSKTTNNVTTYDVNIQTKEIPDYMRSGMTANVSIIVSSLDDVLVIPVSAVIDEAGVSHVYKKNEKGYNLSRVETGTSNGSVIEIKNGLSDGEEIFIRSISLPGKEIGGSPFMPGRARGRR